MKGENNDEEAAIESERAKPEAATEQPEAIEQQEEKGRTEPTGSEEETVN